MHPGARFACAGGIWPHLFLAVCPSRRATQTNGSGAVHASGQHAHVAHHSEPCAQAFPSFVVDGHRGAGHDSFALGTKRMARSDSNPTQHLPDFHT